MRIVAGINLGYGAQLRIRAKNQINARAGPFDGTGCAVASLKHICGLRDRCPYGLDIEHIHQNVIGERLWPLCEHAMLRLADIGIERAQARHKHCHFRCGEGQELRLVQQHFFG